MKNKPDDAEEQARIRAKVEQAFAPPPPPPPKNALFLGRHPVTHEYVYIVPADLNTHLQIVGGSRKGKTNSIKRLVKVLLRRKKKKNEGLSILDPHGELAQYALELCAAEGIPPEDVIYLTLQDVRHVLSMNPVRKTKADPYFQASCVKEALIKIFDQTRSADKPLVSKVLTNLFQAQIQAGLTLLESRFFLNREPQAEQVLRMIVDRLPEGDCRSFWESHFTKSGRDADMESLGPSNRLDNLIRPPVFRRMLGQNHVSLDVLEIMDRGGIAIFDTSIGKNTEITTEGQALFNALIVQQYRQAFPRRTPKGSRYYDPKKTPPHTLIMDEFGGYCTSEFAKSLTESSKFGLRCVFSHQNNQQLIPPDGDKGLYNAVLALPNKIVFGNLPFEEAEELAKHMYLADLDTSKIKYQGETVQWDPVEQWGVTARTETHATSIANMKGRAAGRAGTRSSGTVRSSGTSKDDIGRIVGTQEASSESENEADTWNESENTATTRTETRSTSVTEGRYTTHQKRIKQDSPIYQSIEEQVFLAAQAMSTNARGISVIGTETRKPGLCSWPKMDKRPVTEEQREEFLVQVYDKPVYLPVDQADKLIEERQMKLIEEAKPVEQIRDDTPPRVKVKKPAPVKRKLRTPS